MATIIVTGATGFIGGWLCPLLTRQGHQVLALRRWSATCPCRDWGWRHHRLPTWSITSGRALRGA